MNEASPNSELNKEQARLLGLHSQIECNCEDQLSAQPLTAVGARQSWEDSMLCEQVGVELFEPSGGRGGSLALSALRKVCAGCPVSGECLTDALQFPEVQGVRAGTTAADRRFIRNNNLSIAAALGTFCVDIPKAPRYRSGNAGKDIGEQARAKLTGLVDTLAKSIPAREQTALSFSPNTSAILIKPISTFEELLEATIYVSNQSGIPPSVLRDEIIKKIPGILKVFQMIQKGTFDYADWFTAHRRVKTPLAYVIRSGIDVHSEMTADGIRDLARQDLAARHHQQTPGIKLSQEVIIKFIAATYGIDCVRMSAKAMREKLSISQRMARSIEQHFFTVPRNKYGKI